MISISTMETGSKWRFNSRQESTMGSSIKKITRSDVEAAFEVAVSSLQITDGYQARVLEYAGPLGLQVEVVFKGRSNIAYLLCDQTRRQVWNCALSRLDILKEWTKDQNFSAKFFEDLCQMKSRDLIERTFGSNPPGFIKALAQFGDVAQTAQTYRNLHLLFNEDHKYLARLESDIPLSSKTLAYLVQLPVILRDPKLARLITDNDHEAAFLDFVRAAEALPSLERNIIYQQIRTASSSYEAFSYELLRLCGQFPFPAPTLRDQEQIRHIANETELKLAGDYFGNCLGSMAEAAHRGELQFYEWLGDDQGVFSIRELSGEWVIDELDFFGGTEDRHWEMVREFVRVHLGYPAARPPKSILEATRALLHATTWSSDKDLFG